MAKEDIDVDQFVGNQGGGKSMEWLRRDIFPFLQVR